MFNSTLLLALALTLGSEHHRKGIWMAQLEYAAYATNIGMALREQLVLRIRLVRIDIAPACSNAI